MLLREFLVSNMWSIIFLSQRNVEQKRLAKGMDKFDKTDNHEDNANTFFRKGIKATGEGAA